MPELPEVKTIQGQLNQNLPFKIEKTSKSKVIKSILHTKNPNLKGARIEKISRHGKCLIFHFSNSTFLLSHLGMTGSWRISQEKLKEKHIHYIFHGSESYLSYVDPRRFGHMYFFDSDQLTEYLKRLGPDLLSKKMSHEFIWEKIQKYPNRELKPFLLEQKFFAGSGNYIANEVCARAKLLPTRKNSSLCTKDAKNIKKGFDSILKESIKNSGVTFQGGYSDAFGQKGKGVQNLVVFHQKICGMCKKGKIKKIILKGRGTFYCPQCQL